MAIDRPDHVIIDCADCKHYVGHGITGTEGMAVSVALRPEKITLTREAPADTAFAKLPAGTVESLVKPEAKAALTGILTYHVIAGKHLAADVMKMTSAATVNGQSVDIKVADGKVHVGGATVVTADIICDNGVIHVIDTVLMPK